MHILKLFFIGALALALGACATGPDGWFGSRQTTGAVVGGVAGGLAGSTVGSGRTQVAATLVGAAVGALIGSEIGRALDEQDRQRAYAAAQSSFDSGRTTRWSNADTGHYGTVDPTPTYTSQQGETCRRYQHTMWVEGRNETVEGTACRRSDGSWQIAS